MAAKDSVLEDAAFAQARALLARPVRRERLWPPVAAAFALALASLGFAVAMVAAPPLVKAHPVERPSGR